MFLNGASNEGKKNVVAVEEQKGEERNNIGLGKGKAKLWQEKKMGRCN